MRRYWIFAKSLALELWLLLCNSALAQPPFPGPGFGPPGPPPGFESINDPFRLPFPFDASNLDFMFGGLRGPGGPMGGPERKLLAQFDKNGDKRLDNAERKAARDSLKTNPASSGFGPPPGILGPGGPSFHLAGQAVLAADANRLSQGRNSPLPTSRLLLRVFRSTTPARCARCF